MKTIEDNLRLGRRLLARVQLRYSRVDYQRSPLDNQRSEGSFALVHELTPVSNISINIGDEKVSFRDAD